MPQLHAQVSDDDPFGSQALGLTVLAFGSGETDPSLGVQDAVPGQVRFVTFGERSAHMPRPTRITRQRGDLTVGRHLTGRNAVNNFADLFPKTHRR